MVDPTEALKAELKGRYSIVRELDRGGMAIVYVADDLRHQRQVAIKLLKPELVTSVGAERFLREIRIAAGLEHPNILAVYDSGATDQVLWYTMPFVEGASLRDRLDAETQLSIPETIGIARQVASALGYAHKKKIIHRDIKPANILLSGGTARVADFGIATAVEAAGESKLTETGLSLGTPTYMSPEQAGGTGRIDGRTDIYSLGCVLYEMLTGSPPFEGKTSAAIMARHSMDPVPPVRSVRATVPEGLEHTVLRTLAKVPADRFQTTDELIEALDQAESEGITISGVEMPALATTHSRSVVDSGSSHPLRPLMSGRVGKLGWVVAILAMIVAIAASLFLGRGAMSGGADLDANRVVVFPLVSGSTDAPSGEGENAATMIGHALDGVGPLRWIDGWRLLDEDERTDASRVEPGRWNQLARDRGARFLVSGRIVPAPGDSVIVALELVDAGSDETVGRSEGATSAENPWQGGLVAVTGLLPSLIPGVGEHPLSGDWAGYDPGAVAAFLLGEQAFRRGRFSEAAEHYGTAVQLDSLFVLPALRAAQAYTWMDGGGLELARARTYGDLARKAEAALSPPDRRFAAGFSAFLDGRGRVAADELRAAVELDPGMAIAWLQFGEVFRHLPPTEAYPDSLALDAYERAHAIDSVASAGAYHLLEASIRSGDLERARVLLDRLEAGGADAPVVRRMTVALRCVDEGSEAVDWEAFAAEDPSNAQSTGWMLLKTGAQVPCGRAALRALLDRPDHDETSSEALMAEVTLLLAAEQDSAALDLIGRGIEQVDAGTGRRLALLLEIVTGRFAEQTAEIADYYWQFYGDDYLSARDTGWLHLFGAYEAHRGRLDVATRIADEIQRRFEDTGDPEEAVFHAAMLGHLALAAGDSAAALQAFSSLETETPSGVRVQWHLAPPLGLERYLAAQLYLADSQYVAAIDAASFLDSQAAAYYFPFLQPSLEIRIESARALADSAAEDRYRARLEALVDSG